MADTPRSVPPTTDALRHAIDTGRTGDKIDFPDPAAAPLGTDDEAAGAPASSAQVRRAMDAELQGPSSQTAPAANMGRAGGMPLGFLLALIAFIGVSVVAAMIVLR